MSLHRLNPVMPLIEMLPGGMNIGSQLFIAGSTHLNAERCSINLQCGPNVSPRRDDVALHLSLDFTRRAVIRNSIQNMCWGVEESFGDMPLYPGQPFTITITSDSTQFTIQVNQTVFYFRHRLPLQQITHVTIDGNAVVNEIRFNSSNTMPAGAYPYAGAAGYPTSYPGAGVPPYPGGYPGTGVGGYPPGGYPGSTVQPNQNSGGLMSKLGMGVGGSVVGAALASKLGGKKLLKNNKKMAKKAMKYGIPIAGAGVGAYALSHALGGHHHHKLHFGHHGSSSSSSSSSSDSD